MDKSKIALLDVHRIIIKDYINLLDGKRNPSARALLKFSQRVLRRGWYDSSDKEVLNNIRFDVMTERKRKKKRVQSI